MIKMTDKLTYDTGRNITHGTKTVIYSTGEKTVATATGVQKFAPETEQESKKIFADSRTHYVVYNKQQTSISQTNVQRSKEEMLQAGFTRDGAGGYMDNGTKEPFDVQRIIQIQGITEDGKAYETERLDVFYNCTSSTWTESDDEDEDEINPKTFERTLEVAGRDFEGLGLITSYQIVRDETNKEVFDTYKEKILTPTDFKAIGTGK